MLTMKNTVNMLRLLKQFKSTTYNLFGKRFIGNIFARCNNVLYDFERCRTIHVSSKSLDSIKKTASGNVSDLKHTDNLPLLQNFMPAGYINSSDPSEEPNIPYVEGVDGCKQKVFFDIHGCQMNSNDAEVIWSILKSHGYDKTESLHDAQIILILTCSIRSNAEGKIWNKLRYFSGLKKRRGKSRPLKICLLGCMAERLKHDLVDERKLVDVIAGPDSYRDLPRLLCMPTDDIVAINVLLSFDETYADIAPVRLNLDSTSAYVTIMRGCDNMCTYCIVPFTRGKEKSQRVNSIVNEILSLSAQGVKEVVLLGQNVNSYRDTSKSVHYPVTTPPIGKTQLVKGFKTVYKLKEGGYRFSHLLDIVSCLVPDMRIRFTSPHPKDFPDEVLELMATKPNICKQIHLPAQSGNSAVLERMRRGYTREAYLELVHHIREIIPNISLSSDFIAGFCGETEEEFQDTLSLLELVKYNRAFLFSYSMREKTTAHRRYKDDVESSVKQDRLLRMISVYRTEAEELNKSQIGQNQLVLVEKDSKRSVHRFQGRNDGNMRVIIPSVAIPIENHSDEMKRIKCGDYVVVKIDEANAQTLMGTPLYHSSITKHALSTA